MSKVKEEGINYFRTTSLLSSDEVEEDKQKRNDFGRSSKIVPKLKG